jgi:hypothetical protein
VHQQRQGVRRARDRLRLGLPLALRAGSGDRRENLHVALLELRPQCGQLVVLELVLERERLEDALLDRPALLGLVEDSLNRYLVGDGAQF